MEHRQVIVMRVCRLVRERFVDNHYKVVDVSEVSELGRKCLGGIDYATVPLVFDFDRIGRDRRCAVAFREAGFAGPIIGLTSIPRPIVNETCSNAHEDLEVVFLQDGGDRLIWSPYSLRIVEEVVLACRRRAMLRSEVDPDLVAREAVCSGVMVRVDLSRAETHMNGKRLLLTVSEMKVFSHLLRRPDHVLSRETLMRELGIEHGDPRTIDTHIKRMRTKIAEVAPEAPELFTAIYGVGYRLKL